MFADLLRHDCKARCRHYWLFPERLQYPNEAQSTQSFKYFKKLCKWKCNVKLFRFFKLNKRNENSKSDFRQGLFLVK